jgi:hypothetical protein
MAVLDSESWSFSTTAADYQTYGLVKSESFCSIGTAGPFGDNYLVGNSGSAVSFRSLPGVYPTLFFGVRCPNSETFVFFSEHGTAQCSVVINTSTGVGTVYRGNVGTSLGATSAGVFPSNAWYFLEVGMVIGSGTSGSMVLRLNGTTVLNVPSVNTQGDTTSLGVNYFFANLNFASMGQWYFCDDTGPSPNNNFLGDVRVYPRRPTSNDVVAFTPTGGSNNYQNVNLGVPNPGTDYNIDATIGDTDTFNLGTMAAGLTTIFAVNAKSLLLKTDAGQRIGASVIKSSGTIVDGSNLSLGSSGQMANVIAAVDPATGVAWTVSGASALKPGYTVVS